MTGEDEVTSVLVEYLESEYDNLSIEHGEISPSNGGEHQYIYGKRRRWTADIVGRDRRGNISLAIECKGEGITKQRQGIGQALSFSLYGHDSGLACADMDPRIRDMVKILPIWGFDIIDGTVEVIPLKPRLPHHLEYDEDSLFYI